MKYTGTGPRRRGRLRSASGFLSHHLLRQCDQEAQRSIDYILSLVNRKIYGTVAPRRAVANRVRRGSDGRRDASSGRRPRATVQARDDCKKKNKKNKSNNPHHVRDRCICSYHKTVHVPYIAKYRTVFCKESKNNPYY